MIQKTTLPSAKEMQTTRKWHYFDATEQILGRLASKIAILLIGKHKRTYTPNMDCGDFVVVTNVAKVKVTGTYGVTFTKATGGTAANPKYGIMTAEKIEYVEPPPEKVYLPGMKEKP